MADTYKFPHGGNDVRVVKKAEVLDCISKNITDVEVATAIIDQLEIDIERFAKEGRWTGIPFLGSIRIPPGRKLRMSPEQQQAIKEAGEELDKEKYVMFRKRLAADNERIAKHQRYFNYITSSSAARHKDLYKELCRTRGEHYAKLRMFFMCFIVAVDNFEIRQDL